MTEKIYTWEGLAAHLGTTPGTLRNALNRLMESKRPLVYKGFEFKRYGKGWILIEEGADVEVIDH